MVPDTVDDRYYEVMKPGSLAERLAVIARVRIYQDFLRLCRPGDDDRILDVGVSDVVGEAANLLERRYPHPRRLTAAGLGEAREFRKAFPEISYRRIAAGRPLPFADGEFAVAASNAVLEHVGSGEAQRRFVAELLRVGRKIFITVPNRYFPVEPHTGIPFLHWSDSLFAASCRLLGKSKWGRDEALILMSLRRLAALCPPGARAVLGRTGIKLGPFSSNLFLFAERLP